MGWIPVVIPHKMSAITMLYTSKINVIAPKKKYQGDNIYEKKKSTLNPILAPKYQKNIISKIDFLVLI